MNLEREYCVYCVDMHCTVVARYLSCECMYVITGGLCEQCVGVEAPKMRRYTRNLDCEVSQVFIIERSAVTSQIVVAMLLCSVLLIN